MKKEMKTEQIAIRATETDTEMLKSLCDQYGMNKSKMVSLCIREKYSRDHNDSISLTRNEERQKARQILKEALDKIDRL